MPKRKHPMQRLAIDERGVVCFVENKIVSFLLDAYAHNLNDLRRQVIMGRHSEEDYEQLMMLVGYSVSGFGELDLNRRTISKAERMAMRLTQPKGDDNRTVKNDEAPKTPISG